MYIAADRMMANGQKWNSYGRFITERFYLPQSCLSVPLLLAKKIR